MPSKDTYGATPPSNASATGAADASATLLDGRSPSTAGESSSRFWRDIGICVGALALIVATFFGTIELMNYEYQRTTFEVYTGCMTPATKAHLARAGFDGPVHAAYVVPAGGAPVKMAPAGEHRPGVFVVSTWMPDNEWAFAVAPAHAPETPAVLFSEAGNATVSPLALPRNARCASKSESTGAFARALSEEDVANGAFVSHVFGSCDWSCDSEFAPSQSQSAAFEPNGGVDEMTGDDVTFIESGADTTSPRATGPGVERFSAPPVYPGAPDTNAVLEAPVGEDGFMVLPDGIPSGVVLMEGGDEQAFTDHRQDEGPIDVQA